MPKTKTTGTPLERQRKKLARDLVKLDAVIGELSRAERNKVDGSVRITAEVLQSLVSLMGDSRKHMTTLRSKIHSEIQAEVDRETKSSAGLSDDRQREYLWNAVRKVLDDHNLDHAVSIEIRRGCEDIKYVIAPLIETRHTGWGVQEE